MATFGIIAEGITDQIVIQNILLGCLLAPALEEASTAILAHAA